MKSKNFQASSPFSADNLNKDRPRFDVYSEDEESHKNPKN